MVQSESDRAIAMFIHYRAPAPGYDNKSNGASAAEV